MPAIAGTILQPNEASPKAASPTAIANLPYSGCGQEISLPGSQG